MRGTGIASEVVFVVGVFLGQGELQVDPAESLVDIAFVQTTDDGDLGFRRFDQRPRKEGHPDFLALTVAVDEVILSEIDTFDPEAETFHQPEPGAVQQTGHETLLAIKLDQD